MMMAPRVGLAFAFCFFCFSALLTDCSCILNQRRSRSVRLSMEYSSTELFNLKTITEKKLGPKLGLEYLLVTTTVKASQSRSEILDCIAQSDLSTGDKGKQFKVKIVKEQDRFDRELKNYKVKLCPLLPYRLY